MDNLQGVKEHLPRLALVAEAEGDAPEAGEEGEEGSAGEEGVAGAGQGDVYKPAEPRLLSMPVEIILKICSFLDADFLKDTFTKVCRRFETILADDHIWKYWVHSRLGGGSYPALPALATWRERGVDWRGVCADMAAQRRRWRPRARRHLLVRDVHIASVDTVLLLNNGEMCVSGGRDRGMALWSVRDVADAAPAHVHEQEHEHEHEHVVSACRPRQLRADAHEGWVWDLAPDCPRDTGVVYSASWDNTVKAWDLHTGLTCLETFRCGMSALALAARGPEVVAGLYSKRVLTFDRRAGARPVAARTPHRGPVLALAARGHLLASVSEDRTLCVWDRAAGRALAPALPLPALPVSLSWSRQALYVGDSRGTLHVVDPERVAAVRAHAVWPEPPALQPACKVTACVQAGSSLLLCSARGEIKLMHNSAPPEQFACLRSATVDVTQMRYMNDVLAIGSCDAALEFWVPAD